MTRDVYGRRINLIRRRRIDWVRFAMLASAAVFCLAVWSWIIIGLAGHWMKVAGWVERALNAMGL